MKKFLLTLCVAVASVALFSGCSKDDEEKIVGTWEAYKYVDVYNGRTETGSYEPGEFVVKCMDDGSFIWMEDEEISGTGKYSIADDVLVLRFSDSSEAEVYTIDKLTKSELVITESYDYNEKYTVYFKKK